MAKIAKNKHDSAQLVVKSNSMVQRAVYDLTAQEQKLVLYLVSKIKPDDDCFVEYDFSLKELCAVCGIECHGKNYEDFKSAILSLQRKSFWLDGDDMDVLYTWFSRVLIYKNDTRVKIKFGEDLQPFLLQLRQNYTAYELEKAVALRSKYAIRLYELLKSYAFRGGFTISVAALRKRLDIQLEEYALFNNFKVRVLNKALEEINRYTDITATFEPVYKNRRIDELAFRIERKDALQDVLAEIERKKRLGVPLIVEGKGEENGNE